MLTLPGECGRSRLWSGELQEQTPMRFKSFLAIGLLVLATGCSNDQPHGYGRSRPAVDSLDDRDRGLQSKDLTNASEAMARDLLQDERFRKSDNQWLMVVMPVEDRTAERRCGRNYDIFIERLRTELGIKGQGSVQLVENKAKVGQIRDKELDDRGRGMSRRQPDYALYGKVYDFPNRGTNYYLFEFVVTDIHTGLQAWTNRYEVKVAR
jgi:hypothetical protein